MDFFNFIGEQFQDIGNTIVSALPRSPIVWLQANEEIKLYLSYVNWFFPIYMVIPVVETWLLCIVGYYVFQVILRWVKAIE